MAEYKGFVSRTKSYTAQIDSIKKISKKGYKKKIEELLGEIRKHDASMKPKDYNADLKRFVKAFYGK